MWWGPYISVAQKRKNAQKQIEKLKKKGKKIEPVVVQGKKITKTVWGNFWCTHWESFTADDGRLSRGRTYVRNGYVLDLKITKGKIDGLVQGSSLYKVNITMPLLEKKQWKSMVQKCKGSIGSVLDLLNGVLSEEVMVIVMDKDKGMLPAFDVLNMHCSCPDYSFLCKHIAAVFYGVAARLDHDPQLLFVLRGVNHLDLLKKIVLKKKVKKKSVLSLSSKSLSSLFGVEVETETKVLKKMVKPKKKGV